MMSESGLPEFSTGTALVVGGTGGIGSAICRALAVVGSHVALTYHTKPQSADRVVNDVRAAGREALALPIDLTDPASVQNAVNRAIERFGSLHSVVYAAGPPIEYLYINEIKGAEWARVINADVNGCFNLVEATLPHLRQRKKGSFLAIITAAVDRAPPRDILSAAPKAAIEMLIRGVAREEGRNGIRANCVGPGFIEAGLGLSTIHESTQDYVNKMVRAVPLKRAGKAEDVADVAIFLLSEKARYVTGVSIPVAGGLQLV
jgi:NAD(P)-dependent dehydrogenase (short-subunit alcohol dehydrogenase family)